jgi:hypothetical protein
MDVEPRIARLEDAMSGIPVALGRLEERSVAAEARFDRLDRRLDRTDAKLDGIAAQLAGISGRLEMMPSTWQMIVAIIGGQVALAGLLAAVIFGVAHLLGKI